LIVYFNDKDVIMIALNDDGQQKCSNVLYTEKQN